VNDHSGTYVLHNLLNTDPRFRQDLKHALALSGVILSPELAHKLSDSDR
jgi:hypothetical protein